MNPFFLSLNICKIRDCRFVIFEKLQTKIPRLLRQVSSALNIVARAPEHAPRLFRRQFPNPPATLLSDPLEILKVHFCVILKRNRVRRRTHDGEQLLRHALEDAALVVMAQLIGGLARRNLPRRSKHIEDGELFVGIEIDRCQRRRRVFCLRHRFE